MKSERGEIIRLRERLAEAEETLRAIRGGEVDAFVVAGKQGPQVFTLQGAEHAYRLLIESMNEGAVTLTADKTILYANRCFARMVKCPLEKVTGGSFRRFLSTEDRAMLRPLLKRPNASGSKILVLLHATDGSQMPVHISIRPLAKNGSKKATLGMVVTDMTEARRNEELLRTLTHRVVQAQEAERRRVASELHDGITQLLCAVLFHSQALVKSLSGGDGPAKGAAMRLLEMAGKTAQEVERISHDLRPSVLDELGLIAAMRDTQKEFSSRTSVPVRLICEPFVARMPEDVELALYRILQEALRNVEKHARARHVTVRLMRKADFIRLEIRDDGIGFDPNRRPTGRKGKGGLGLLSMRERTTHLGGAIRVKSTRRAGTTIDVRIPLLNR